MLSWDHTVGMTALNGCLISSHLISILAQLVLNGSRPFCGVWKRASLSCHTCSGLSFTTQTHTTQKTHVTLSSDILFVSTSKQRNHRVWTLFAETHSLTVQGRCGHTCLLFHLFHRSRKHRHTLDFSRSTDFFFHHGEKQATWTLWPTAETWPRRHCRPPGSRAHTQPHRHTQPHSHTDRHTETHTDTHRHTVRQTQTHTDTVRGFRLRTRCHRFASSGVRQPS